MNRKQKKELRRHLSTRQLMGIEELTEHGLKTAKGELVFYLVSPDNLSVLSAEGVRGRVRALTEFLRSMETVELLSLDSRESFQSNKHHYQARLEQAGRMMRGGSIVDATLISAPSSTKNAEKKRDPEMHQTKKGNQWHFGMKCHTGVDAGSIRWKR